jgi:hypothetical protein
MSSNRQYGRLNALGARDCCLSSIMNFKAIKKLNKAAHRSATLNVVMIVFFVVIALVLAIYEVFK